MLEALLVRPVPGLVEIIHIQLADKTGEIIVLEVFGQYLIGELIYLFHCECIAFFIPGDYVIGLRIAHDVIRFHQEGRHVRVCVGATAPVGRRMRERRIPGYLLIHVQLLREILRRASNLMLQRSDGRAGAILCLRQLSEPISNPLLLLWRHLDRLAISLLLLLLDDFCLFLASSRLHLLLLYLLFLTKFI